MTTGPADVIYAGLVTRAIAITIDALLINAAAFAVTGAVFLLESLFSIPHKHNKAVAVHRHRCVRDLAGQLLRRVLDDHGSDPRQPGHADSG